LRIAAREQRLYLSELRYIFNKQFSRHHSYVLY
jgi:hypothetical protein